MGIKTGDVAIVAVNKPKEALLDERLGRLINRHRIMVFMKGIPSSPKCGFSRQIVNILEDEEVRQGLKKYSDWPTYPQLYLGGELIGGLDILKEMQESGDMDDLLEG